VGRAWLAGALSDPLPEEAARACRAAMFILLSPDAGGPTARAHAGSGASATPPRKVQVQLRRLEGTDRGLFRPLARLCATTHQLCADQAEGEPVSSKREELADALARLASLPAAVRWTRGGLARACAAAGDAIARTVPGTAWPPADNEADRSDVAASDDDADAATVPPWSSTLWEDGGWSDSGGECGYPPSLWGPGGALLLAPDGGWSAVVLAETEAAAAEAAAAASAASEDAGLTSTSTVPPPLPTVPPGPIEVRASFVNLLVRREGWRGRVRASLLRKEVVAADAAGRRVLAEAARAAAALAAALVDHSGLAPGWRVAIQAPLGSDAPTVRAVGADGRPLPASRLPLAADLARRGLAPPRGATRTAAARGALSTAGLEAASEAHARAGATAGAAVAAQLRALCAELADPVSGHLDALVATCWVAAIHSILSLHARQAHAMDWTLAAWADDSRKDPAGGALPTPLVLRGLRPFWLPRGVPSDIELDRLSLLTGPNMGGKSSLLRAVGAAALLTRTGLAAPCAEGSSVPYLDAVVLRNFAGDDPAGGASSFAVEMAEMAQVVADATPDTLLLVDELGRGTDPLSGAALAAAFLLRLTRGIGGGGCVDMDRLPAPRPRGLWSTHFTRDLIALGSPSRTSDDDAACWWGPGTGDLPLDPARPASSDIGLLMLGGGDADGYGGDDADAPFRLSHGVSQRSQALRVAAVCGVEGGTVAEAARLRAALANSPAGCGEAVAEVEVPSRSDSVAAGRAGHDLARNALVRAVVGKNEWAQGAALAQVLTLGRGEVVPANATGKSFVYALELEGPDAGRWYVGETDDLPGRLRSHAEGATRGGWASALAVAVAPSGGKSAARRAEAEAIRLFRETGLFLRGGGADAAHSQFGAH